MASSVVIFIIVLAIKSVIVRDSARVPSISCINTRTDIESSIVEVSLKLMIGFVEIKSSVNNSSEIGLINVFANNSSIMEVS